MEGANLREGSRATDFEPITVAGSLPPVFGPVFPFRYFNSIQTECFHSLYHSRDSVCVASPTGSGKTSLFELAILGMLKEGLTTDGLTGALVLDPIQRGQRKAIYVAPMRSLVQEKAAEWKARFGNTLGLTVNEFTGEHWSNGIDELEQSDIILTTPERFDSITRRAGSCKDAGTGFLPQVCLVMLDEVHLLAENRGPSLEAIVSRLKLSKGLAVAPRFMACSATFRNVEDVAQWLGAPPRATFSFGNEMRPVPLEINIKTYQFSSNNEFMFSKKLDDHVYSVLVEYSGGKPALCFCHTKAETSRLAKKLSSEYRNNDGQGVFVSDAQHRSLLLDASRKIRDDGLKKSIREGVGYHNADLSMEDKAIVEDLFSKKQLRVVATTSTLAMGVNLPAHLVIIKGVRVYRGNSQYAMLDYSSILQMIGRAGRPQFDVKGVAVIMAQPKDKSTLDNILNLSEVVESSLIECLAECLNAEICNGMVTDVSSAMAWVQTTYLFARITKNPGHYGVPYDESVKGHEAIVTWLRDSILRGTISKLVSRGMVSTDERGLALSSTAPGVLMAENYVRLETMSLIAKLGARSTLEDFAWVIAGSVELGDSLIVRRNEKKWLNKINASALARYSIKDPAKPGSRLKRIQLPSQKAFALMMFDLSSECRAMIKKEASRDSGPIQGLIRDASTVVSKGTQIAKCIVRYFEATHGTASALCEALVFKKVLDRRLWPDDPFLITQTKGIGETIATRLVNNNIGTLRQILATDARQLEIIAGLRPPQGTVMQDNVGMLCPAPLRVSTRLEERRTTMVADVTIKVADGSHNAPNNTKDGWCRIVVFNSSSNAVLYSRRVRYSLFAKDRGGLRLQVDTCSPPDAESNIVVRIIDETVLGVDVRESTPLLPSTEAESRRVHGALDLLTPVTNGIAAVDPSRSIANGPAGVPRAAMDRPDVVGVSEKKRAAVSKRETTKGRASEKARGPIEKARGPSPTAQQTKLNFAPKKRARITSETENVEVIDLLDDDDGSAGKATEKKTPQPSSSPDADADAKSRRVTSTSECAEFQSTYGSFLSSLELFMADDNP